MNFVFLGGIFLPRQIRQIEHDEQGIMQNAADAFQKAILKGLWKNGLRPLRVVNVPFISSYPQAYRRWFFRAAAGTLYGEIPVDSRGFVNIRFARIYARLFAGYFGLGKALRGNGDLVFVYSAHLPLIIAALIQKFLRYDVRICLILPDLPEFVGEVGMYRSIVLSVEKRLFRLCLKWIDCFVLITAAMAERLKIPAYRFVIVEGIFDPDAYDGPIEPTSAPTAGRTFLYSGAISKRYGIDDLLESFRSVKDDDIRLVICGEGDARDAVVTASTKDSRIEYRGQLRRDEVLALQRSADVLVNPRRPEGEFTRYSFPSKTLEYLASGRPIIMHDLPAMPRDYLDFVMCPATPDVSGLTQALRDCVAMPLSTLDNLGRRGQEFVLKEKTPAAQCAKIAALVFGVQTQPGSAKR